MNGHLYDFVLLPVEKFHLSKMRADLLSAAHGKTLEIGAGTGLNFPHYPTDVQVTAIDNDESMLSASSPKNQGGHVNVEVADAENLPYADNEFDTVVATLVFCSVPNPDRALSEVYRVLKPGGSFLLLEHVRKNTPIAGKVLDTLTPAWKLIAGGCHLNRDPGAKLQQLGFKTESLEVIWKGLGKIWRLKKVKH